MSFLRKLRLRLHPYKTLRNDYLARLRGSLAGADMLHEGNVYCFDEALRLMPAQGAVLEIGSFAGMSTNVICGLMRQHGINRPFFTCDPWVYGGYYDAKRKDDPVYMAHFEGTTHITREDYTAFIKASFIRNTRFFSGDLLPHTCALRSDDFFDAWRQNALVTDVFERPAQLGGPLAFVYVDGDHTDEAVRKDVENALEFLVPGGYLLLDDSADYWNYGSVRLAQELKRRPELELVRKNPNYMYQKKP